MKLNFRGRLVPAVVQDRRSGKVLMLGYMNQEAFDRSLSSGFVTFFSRSRRKLWTKGETSGHRLRLCEMRLDCDGDALLVQAELTGPGCCHEGYESCFYRRLTVEGEAVVDRRAFDPAAVYAPSSREERP